MVKYKGETRKYQCESGVYLMPATHCVFCKNCTDIFYDYTNGPYMFLCELNKQEELEITETECRCEYFEDDGYIFDEEKYLQEQKEIQEKINEQMKAMEGGFSEFMDKIIQTMKGDIE